MFYFSWHGCCFWQYHICHRGEHHVQRPPANPSPPCPEKFPEPPPAIRDMAGLGNAVTHRGSAPPGSRGRYRRCPENHLRDAPARPAGRQRTGLMTRRVLLALRAVSPVERLFSAGSALAWRLDADLEVLADPAHPNWTEIEVRLSELARSDLGCRLSPVPGLDIRQLIDYARCHEGIVSVVVGRPARGPESPARTTGRASNARWSRHPTSPACLTKPDC